MDNYLYERGYRSACIHGDRNQREREDALKTFRDGRTPILVATAVSSIVTLVIILVINLVLGRCSWS